MASQSIALSFGDFKFDVVDRNNQPWIQSRQLATALGYKDEMSVTKIYERNADEFSSMMTAKVNLTLGVAPVEVRIFSLRGCHLIAMFARTRIAKAFRVWVLDVLDSLDRPKATPSRLSTRSDAERKEFTAMINAWVNTAPIGYAVARSVVNAHFGVKSVDDLTVEQVKAAIAFVQGKIAEASQPQPALPAAVLSRNDAGLMIEPHFLRIRSLVKEIHEEELAIYDIIKQHRGDVLRALDSRRSMMVNMYRVMDKLFCTVDNAVEAVESHAKSMCVMNEI